MTRSSRGTAIVLGEPSPAAREISSSLTSAGFSVALLRPSASGAEPLGTPDAPGEDVCALFAPVGDDPDAVEHLVEGIETSTGPVSLLVVVADEGTPRDVTATAPHHLRQDMARHFFVAAWLTMTLVDTMRDVEDSLVVHVESDTAVRVRPGYSAAAAAEAAVGRLLEGLGTELRAERAMPRVASVRHPASAHGADTAALILGLVGDGPSGGVRWSRGRPAVGARRRA